MATMFRDLIGKGGTHDISTINSKNAVPYPNGAILKDGDLDNGLLVELDGFDADGNRTCIAWAGTNKAYIVQTSEQDQMLTEYGEDDFKNFYNAKDEIVRIYKVFSGLRQETSAYKIETGHTIAFGSEVLYDTANKIFIVGGTASSTVISVGIVVGIDTDFGENAGKSTIRIEYK